MPSTLLTAATDIFVIAGAAAVATAAINSKRVPFMTSLGAEHDDDSLLAAETSDTHKLRQSPFQKHADNEKKAPTVTVKEVAVTPPVAEMQEGGDFFASAKAA